MTIHLHWLYQHPKHIGTPTLAIALCGANMLKPNQWERYIEDGVTCPRCLALADEPRVSTRALAMKEDEK